MKKVSHDSGDTKEIRKELLKKQGGIDPITGLTITSPVVDHCHFSGHIRAVLQREVNSFEGKVVNAYNRYIKHLGVPFDVVLNGIIDYHNMDYTGNPIHHSEITKMVNKIAYHLKSGEQKELVLKYYPDVDVKNVKQRKKYIREILKSGNEWDCLEKINQKQ